MEQTEKKLRHNWQTELLTEADMKGENHYGEKKFVCTLCGCQKHTWVHNSNGKIYYGTSYSRSGMSFANGIPDCWGAKNPV